MSSTNRSGYRLFSMQRSRSLCKRVLSGGMGLWIALVLSGYTWKGKGKPPNEQAPPPYLLLARQALQSRDTKAAQRVLEAARLCWSKHKQACGFSRQNYLITAGIFLLESGQPQRAIALFQEAQTIAALLPKQDISNFFHPKSLSSKQKNTRDKESKERPTQEEQRYTALSLWFYLGQALYRVGRFRESAEALEHAEGLGRGISGFYRLWSRAWSRAGKVERARQILEKGLRCSPQDIGLLREAVVLYAEAGFFQAATQTAQKLARLNEAEGAQTWLMLLDRMRTTSASPQRLELLEALRLRFPRNDGILVRRCVAWATSQAHRAAAACFAQMAHKMPEMAYYAAAAYLQAGDLFQALRWNQHVPSEPQRTRQRAALWLSQRAYAQVFALLWPMWEKRKLQEVERYRLAYSALQIGRYKEASALLQSLRKTPMGAMGQGLEAVLVQCQQAPWLCVAH
ncbi:hypothetical protein L6R29_15675 [Myxococcota bacterium]|nr:hypothetical protein [Myxococcota bacterium]